MLVRTAQDYERAAKLIAPALEQLRQSHPLTLPIVEEALREQTFEVAIDAKPVPIALAPDDIVERIARRVIEIIEEKKPTPKARASYQLPAGAKWEKLRLKFFDDHTIKAKYPGIPTG
ncbi:MAG: hypothetical protein RLZZ416_89, partial [Candidatus Parcubacteria bacterium]